VIAPHQEAIDLLKRKPVVTRQVFDELLPELRGRAFTITGIEDADVLQRVRDAIAEVPRGTTWDDAKKDITAELDPWMGENSERHAELLLRTHAFQAFQASNWRVAQEDEDTTHLQYLATEDDHVRDSHLALNGVPLAKRDEFWDKDYPPWEWGCRCRVRPMNPDLVDMEREADADRNPEDRNVIEGPALTKLREGTLNRGGQTFDVSAPSESNPNAFQWHPDNLRIAPAQLKDRYDPEVWTEFRDRAQNTEITQGVSMWEWLNGKHLKT